MDEADVFNRVFRWRRTRYGPLGDGPGSRFGMACRVFARGRNGSIGVEFEDGYRCVTMRYAVRRRGARNGLAAASPCVPTAVDLG